jgi:hypothetical protein
MSLDNTGFFTLAQYLHTNLESLPKDDLIRDATLRTIISRAY